MKKDSLSQAMLIFSFFEKISPLRLQKIIKHFSSVHQALDASAAELEKAGLKQETACEFCKFKNDFKISEMINKMESENIKFTHLFADDYPSILKEIYDAPIVLYYKGKIYPWPENSLAIVGARKHSYYGEKALKELLLPLGSSDLAIISGLALGIDSLAHQNALQNNNLTFAVLGSGVDKYSIYPPENYALSEKIIKSGGALISEFPPGSGPTRYNFPRRNRIIAGLSKAILVVEAEKKSGSLISARCALEENRDVLAIPGSIFSSLSQGTNKLIASGAKIINETSDILDHFPNLKKLEIIKNTNQISANFLKLSEQEKTIYLLIQTAEAAGKSLTSDEMVNLSKLDSVLINSTLSILEIAGIIKRDGPAYILN